MDDLTPIEPMFSEQPFEPLSTPDYYGTGTHPEKIHSPSRWIALVLLSVIAFHLATFVTLLRMNATTSEPSQTQTGDSLNPISDFSTADAQTSSERREVMHIESADNQSALSLQELYQKVAPSVVVVSAQGVTDSSCGTGVILTEDGYLLTNAHTVSDRAQLEVTLSDGTDYDAAFVGLDTESDLAVLKLSVEGLTPAEFGSTEDVLVGDEVVVFSNVFGKEMAGTMTEATVSAINDSVSVGELSMQVIQLNAKGLSSEGGGIVVNSAGQVIGIGVRQIGGYRSYDNDIGVGFALSSQQSRELVNDLLAYGSVGDSISLGIEVTEITAPMRSYWRLPEGVLISKLTLNGDAYRAGLRPGDVLLSIGDDLVDSLSNYLDALGKYDIGDTVRVTLYRSGNYYYTDITITENTD